MSPTVFHQELVPSSDPLTDRARATWTAGDFGRIATGYAAGAAEFIARLAPAPGERVLDVACGTGNLALPAARIGAITTGIDIAPNLIAQAAQNAAAEGLNATFDVGNAEDLPYSDASFDLTVSMFGAMFAARAEKIGPELMRVTRHGGRIAMANWTPEGFVGTMLRAVTAYVPPPPGSVSVLQWGEGGVIREAFADAARIDYVRRRITFTYPLSAAGTVRLFRDWYGPIVRAFATLDDNKRERLEGDLIELWESNNLAQDGTTRVESEYLEVVVVR